MHMPRAVQMDSRHASTQILFARIRDEEPRNRRMPWQKTPALTSSAVTSPESAGGIEFAFAATAAR